MGEHIKFVEKPLQPTKGSAGLKTQLPGCDNRQQSCISNRRHQAG